MGSVNIAVIDGIMTALGMGGMCWLVLSIITAVFDKEDDWPDGGAA